MPPATNVNSAQPPAVAVLPVQVVAAKVPVHEEDNRICECIEKNASIVLIVLLIFLLDMAYLFVAGTSGGIANLRNQNGIFPGTVHRWQKAVETKQIYLCKASMDLMCSSILNVVYGFLSTASFLWPVPGEAKAVSILLGNIALQVVGHMAAVRIHVLVKIGIIAVYHWYCTMSRNKFGVCLLVQAVFCGDILGQSPFVVRWFFIVFFLARMCEMAPVVSTWLRIGVCFTQVSVDFSQSMFSCMRVPRCVVDVAAKQCIMLIKKVIGNNVTSTNNSDGGQEMEMDRPLKTAQPARGRSPGRAEKSVTQNPTKRIAGRPKGSVNHKEMHAPVVSATKAITAQVASAITAPVAGAINAVPAPVANALPAPVANAVSAPVAEAIPTPSTKRKSVQTLSFKPGDKKSKRG